MNYRMRRQGEDLGIFPLDELRRRRESGELSGSEYLQAEGKSDWQPLDLVLQQGYSAAPPPLPPAVPKSGPSPGIIWLIIACGVVFFILVVTFFTYMIANFQRGYQAAIRRSVRAEQSSNQSNPQAMAAASKPVVWTTNTLTAWDTQKRGRAFRIRQWIDGYEKYGLRNPASDAEALLFLRVWIDRYHGGPEATNKMSLSTESDRLANDPDCTDPLVLTVAADESLNIYDKIHRFERALAIYPKTDYKAYPRLYATLKLMDQLGNSSDRAGVLDTSALELLPKCFADGSFTPADQQNIAEIFVYGWGEDFFDHNGAAIRQIVHQQGPAYRWLALVLDGENDINQAWKVRGSGYADSVTKEGWEGFNANLAKARKALTEAWKLEPNYPLAPCRMMTVALGESSSSIREMRVWFDRTLADQIDYDGAWSEMRWGLRPRWYGSHAAMLALGRTALKTGRFDTDVPYQFFHCVADVESEMSLPPGRHIYGRSDIWPEFQKMYEGYIDAPAQSRWGRLNRWRSAYAIVAYFAGKYPVARKQLEALNWHLAPANLRGWNVDLSLMPLEVAARTGPLGAKISAAESAYDAGKVESAYKQYNDLLFVSDNDAKTKKFIDYRLAQLTVEDQLYHGKWVDLMPANDHDLGWVFSFGKVHRRADGALEVEYGPKGHMLFSRANVGRNFEVRGQFEVVRSSNKNFQAGLVMGTPDFDGDIWNWYGFRIKRHDVEGDVVCLGVGWSGDQIVRHVVLNDVTNSFDFILRNGRVTASVNGVEVFHQAAPPRRIRVPQNAFRVGLGAFSDSQDAVIRYRNVRLRKLP